MLLYHGLGGDKEGKGTDLERLARAGFLAVGLDNVGHGERRYADFADRFNEERARREGAAAEADFLAMVRETAHEAPAVVDALMARGWTDPERLGIAGTSMGGYITYAAVLADRRFRAATPIIGSPEWGLPLPESPHHHPARFFPLALLSQNAEMDTTVPSVCARTFHQRLEPYYASAPERLRYVEYPSVGHAMSPPDWEQAWRRALDWLARFL